MLPNTLNSGEVKNTAGSMEPFENVSNTANTRKWRNISLPTSKPCELTISHQEIGEGIDKRRRSVMRFDRTNSGQVDATKLVKASCYVVLDSPIGQLTDLTLPREVMAHLMCLFANSMTGNVIGFDGTAIGARTLTDGTL